MLCSLCDSEIAFFSEINKRRYYRCKQCKGILLDPDFFLSTQAEKERYLLHKNDVNDPGYQKFVSPIISDVLKDFNTNHKGLDFGSGSGPIVTSILHESGYNITAYDPIFEPNKDVLKESYDYIICCEVMEHFYNPAKEFELLYSLLNPKGALYCKTNLYDNTIDFDTWWYKNDTTHVFFYTKDTLHWIATKYGYATPRITKDFILFIK